MVELGRKAALMLCLTSGLTGKGVCQSLVSGERLPVRTVDPLYVISTVEAVNVAVHPESQS